MKKIWQKILSLIAALAIIFNALMPAAFAVYAQEETESATFESTTTTQSQEATSSAQLEPSTSPTPPESSPASIPEPSPTPTISIVSITSDKTDYQPNETVIVTGSRWQAGETISLTFNENPQTHPAIVLYATADEGGVVYNNEFVVQEHDRGVTFTLTARGLASGLVATVTFTDALSFSAIITPTTVFTSTSSSYSITVTNNSTASEGLGAGKIQIPDGFAGIPAPGTTLTYSTNPSGKSFNVRIGSTGVDTKRILFNANSPTSTNKLTPGQSITINITVAAPDTAGSYEWTTEAFTGANFQDPYPTPATQPTVNVIEDTTPPISSFSNPADNSYWNTPIPVEGNSSDDSEDTVDFVNLYASFAGDENWFQIAQTENTDLEEPFGWSFDWTPDEEGAYDIKAEATDTAGNIESSPVVENITYDTTDPTGSWDAPAADATVNGIVELEVSASDETAGVKDVEFQYKRNDGVDDFQHIATDDTNVYSTPWDTTALALDNYTLRAIITDNAGNTTTLDQNVDVAAVVSSESSITPSQTSAVVTWITDRPTSSRVVYDTVSHPALGTPPNYGYAFSTATLDTSPKVTSHSVTITGLSDGTVYYYRTVSEGSPTTVGEERAYKTLTHAGPGGGGDGGGGAGLPSPAVAGVSAPAPLLILGAAITTEEVSLEEEILGEKIEATPRPTPQEPTEAPQIFMPTRSLIMAVLAVIVLLVLVVYFLRRK